MGGCLLLTILSNYAFHISSYLNVFNFFQDSNCGLSAILSNGSWKKL